MTCDNVWAPKDPADDLDYKFDFKGLTNGVDHAESDWLADGETISEYVVTVPEGLTEGEGAHATAMADTNTSVVVWLSGGTSGQDYIVSCEITTSDARTVKKSHTLSVI